MSFLDQLKNQAQARQAELRGNLAVIERNTALAEAACLTAWRYLDELGRQLEVLQPVSRSRYMIDARVICDGLQLRDFVADIRRKRVRLGPLTERDVIDHIILGARLHGPRGLQVAKDFPPEIERLEARLAQAGIRCLGEPRRDPVSGHYLETRYDFDVDIVVSTRVLPLHEAGEVQFVLHNLDGLVTQKARFAAHEVTQHRLDELAKWWVGEPHRFLDGALAAERIEPF